MAKQDKALEVASLDPSEFLQGGLKDDFRGKILEAVYAPWDYDGNIDEPVLAARLTIQAEDEEEPVVQNWSAGNLDAFVPSEDGKTACDGDEVGPYALRVGKRAQLNNNTNFSHLMQSIIDAGEASKGKHFTRKDLTASLACLVGLDAQWNRVPQKKRAGLADTIDGEGDEKKKNRGRDVLVVTEVFGYGEDEAPAKKGKGDKKSEKAKAKAKEVEEDEDDEEEEDEAPVKSKKADKGKKKPVEDDDDDDDAEEVGSDDSDDEDDDDGIDGPLRKLVVKAIKATDGELKKGKLVAAIVDLAKKDPNKAKYVKRCTEASFIEDDDAPWSYDEDSGVLSIE